MKPNSEPHQTSEASRQNRPLVRLPARQPRLALPVCVALAILLSMSVGFAAGSATNSPASSDRPRSVLEGHPRLAIGPLGTGSDSLTGTLMDLLAAELTASNRFELVERASLQTALREIGLSLAGYAKPADSLRLGHLLRADLMLLGGSASMKQTNTLVARLVDAHTGVILDMTIIPAPYENLRRAAAALAKFANEAGRSGSGAPSTFLAVSTFENLGVNRRYPNFSDDLAAAIVASYQGTKVTILERQIIETLFDEMRLSLSGLAEDTGPLPEMKSTFWLVDGFYQSYEKAGPEVELILRVQKMRGGRTTIHLTGQPGPEFVSRVKKAIDDALAAPAPALLDVVHRDEVQAQMALGMQRADMREEDLADVFIPLIQDLGGAAGLADFPQRVQNLEQAMKAFQTVLLLDPANDRAQICLALCMISPYINRLPEARALLREVYDRAKDETTRKCAFKTLLASYVSADFNRQTDLLKNYEEAKQLRDQFPQSQASIDIWLGSLADTLMKQGRISFEENLPYAISYQRTQLDHTAYQLEIGRGFVGFEFNHLLHACNFDKPATAKAVNEILPSFIEKYPNLQPYLLAVAVPYQVTTNSPVIADFRAAFVKVVSDPTLLPHSPSFYSQASLAATWARDWRLFDLAAEILEARRAAAQSKQAAPLDDRALNVLGTAYIGMGRWQEALPIFELLERKTTVRTDAKALADLAALCRQKLGLPAPAPETKPGAPAVFKLRTPELVLPAESVFAMTSEGLWIATPSQLYLYLGGSNLTASVSLRGRLAGSPLCIAAGEGKVWIGTSGEGLLELDRETSRISRLTEKDGLLMERVSALHLYEGRLWIGHARAQVGGVSALDLRSHKLTTFVPPLLSDPKSGSQINKPKPEEGIIGLDAAPRFPVMSIAHADSEEIWFGVWGRGGQRYWVSKDKWDTVIHEGQVGSVDANSRFEVLGSKGSGFSLRSRLGGEPRDFRCDYGEGKGQLPNLNAAAVALGSDKLWIGGRGYVAVLDIPSFRIERLAYIADTELKEDIEVRQLQLSERDAWILTEKCLYRVPQAFAE